ncbi:MAG: energy-coupling factor transporter ATPase [Clostridiales bacterium]|nr:energy-coupling factor transporter ATPase [Clostridiales bacterium]
MEAIKFEKVYFSYEKPLDDPFLESAPSRDAFSLDGIDFSINEGEFVAVLGHNGSGKSTLARLVNGLLTPESGKITVFGMENTEENLFEIRKNVGIVFQNPDNQMVASIVEDDVAFGPENIGIEREEIGRRIGFALSAVGMEKYRLSMPNRLSGGQKQRIAIAGALALKPRVLILDESTAMLDPRGRKEVMDVVLRLNKQEKMTVLLITHFPEEAVLADRAIVLSKGKIVLQGKPQDVLCDEEKIEKYGLRLPKATRICRELTRRGISMPDCLNEKEFAKNFVQKLNDGGTCAVNDEFDEKTLEKEKIGAGIVCKNLKFTYNPSSPFETHALENVDLEIPSGSFFGIIGHTGSGKSTFVQHLNGLIKLPTAEKKYKEKKNSPKVDTVLTVGEFDLTKKDTNFNALRKKVGMVFQYPEQQLFAETVFDDVAFGLKNFLPEISAEETENLVRQALETVGLDYERIKGVSPFELSGGQKRRVAIAGVIVTKPEILVLDEPAAGLDPVGKEEIMRLLHSLHSSWCKTVVVVSHDMDEIAENCDRVAVFGGGRVVAKGITQEFFSLEKVAEEAGLDLPFTAKASKELSLLGVNVSSDLTARGFVRSLVEFVKRNSRGWQNA